MTARKAPSVPTCASPTCGRPCDSPHRFEVRQPDRYPWSLCSLACLITWARLWRVRLAHEADPERERAER